MNRYACILVPLTVFGIACESGPDAGSREDAFADAPAGPPETSSDPGSHADVGPQSVGLDIQADSVAVPCSAAADCDDSDPCTDDSCDPFAGCTHTHNTASCDDGDPCTTGDSCQGGTCKGIGLFETSFSGLGHETAAALAVLPDGGFAMVGWSEMDGPPVLWVVRTDARGTKLWDRTIVAPAPDGFASNRQDIVVMPGGGFAILATVKLKGPSGSLMAMWLARTDPEGAVVWQKTHQGENWWMATDLVALADGGLAFSGTCMKSAQGNGCLFRTDGSGNQAWQAWYDQSDKDELLALEVLPDGGFAMAGITSSPDRMGGGDGWLVRSDEAGTLLWQKVLGEEGDDGFVALDRLADGRLVLAGFATPGGTGARQARLTVTDSNGTPLWTRTYGGPSLDEFSAVSAFPDGGVALAGLTASKGLGGTDAWLVRVDPAGQEVWDRTFGESGNDCFRAMARLPDGGLAMAGARSDQYAFDDFLLVRTNAWGHSSCGETGACAGMGLASCDDGDPCTSDLCQPQAGCVNAGLPEGTTCLDGDECTMSGVCHGGLCVSEPTDCDDGDDCTADSCNPLTGCAHVAAQDGTPCDDLDPCTIADSCAGGSCSGEAAPPACGGKECGVDACGASCGECKGGQACGADGQCIETCGDVTQAGCCDGSVVTWCEDFVILKQDCLSEDRCGWNHSEARYTCDPDNLVEPTGKHPRACGAPCTEGQTYCVTDQSVGLCAGGQYEKYSCHEVCNDEEPGSQSAGCGLAGQAGWLCLCYTVPCEEGERRCLDPWNGLVCENGHFAIKDCEDECGWGGCFTWQDEPEGCACW